MKKFNRLFAGTVLFLAGSACAFAAEDVAKLEAYAHPTMFGSNVYEQVKGDEVYTTGTKVLQNSYYATVKNKEQVLINSSVKDVLSLIKDKTTAEGKDFNVKMPVLRSELAVILAENFGLKDTKTTKPYADITDKYWAAEWIYGALNAGVMIGYPDGNFKPDQAVTKAEVFATIAQLIDVKTDKSLIVPDFKNKEIKFIPTWAIAPTKEVVASTLLDEIPEPCKVNKDEYLSKEQVAYLVGTLKADWVFSNNIARDKKASEVIKTYTPVTIDIKMADRISARHSNVGDKFQAETTKAVTIDGVVYEEGSKVYGEVIEVVRPGIKNAGYIKIKFNEIKCGDNVAKFPENITSAQANVLKNPNVVARVFGFPFSAADRVVGVTGRGAASILNISGNGLEKLGDNLSGAFVETLSLKPVAGLKDLGNGFITVGEGIFDITKVVTSGTFGIVYEAADEVRYLVAPNYANSSSLNPSEELTIVY